MEIEQSEVVEENEDEITEEVVNKPEGEPAKVEVIKPPKS